MATFDRMRLFLFCFMFLFSSKLQAQLKEFSVSELPTPEVSVVQANAQFQDDALMLVYSALEGLEFRSSLGGIDKVSYNSTASRYEVLVKPKKQMIFVAKAGFIENKISTLNPNPKEVLYFKVEEKKNEIPAQSEPGFLQINTTPPGADIFLNGIQIIDKTPFKGSATAGSTRIKLRKKKYVEFDTTITIESQKTSAVSVAFKSSYLYLSISSNPSGATVKLDGVELGKTPLNREIDLSDNNKQGSKTLRLELDNYEAIESPIDYLPSNKPLELDYELKKRKGKFLINSVPEGASVYIDGAFKGITPYSSVKEFGTYEVYVQMDEFRTSEKKRLSLTSSENQELVFKLSPLRNSEGDSIVYNEVKIGDQIWMSVNLNTNRYQNGDLIPEMKSDKEWKKAGENKQPAWCYYDNDSINGDKYGKLYNWYAVADSRGICPAGWHAPSDNEWTHLVEYLGGNLVAGGKMKSATSWRAPNSVPSLNSKFNGLPGGFCNNFGTFSLIGDYGDWWSSNEVSFYNDKVWTVTLCYIGSSIIRDLNAKEFGFSVRCIKDQ
jgi:uncharacterized protein (TIGR02145 family)